MKLHIDWLKRIAVYIEKKQAALFSYDVNKQKEYLEKQKKPKTDIERSYLQYKCQMKLYNPILVFFMNLASLLLIFIFLIKVKNSKSVVIPKDAIFIRNGIPHNVLPNTLKDEYIDIEYEPENGMSLSKDDKKFIKCLSLKYPLSWHFLLKSIIKISKYSYVIKKYTPKAIIVCAEYSFTSSLLTSYCNKQNIEHIDVMHGEKLFFMRDSFFKFNRCYVWNEFYIKLFTQLKADCKQFLIEVPNSLKFNNDMRVERQFDVTYYLGAESEEILFNISKILKQLSQDEMKISVRPHPRYSDIEQINSIFSFASIENTKEILIEESLMRTKHAVSLYSTVLNQALNNGIEIVIDDMSNPDYYNKLKELRYVCLNKEHKLLSEMLFK